MVKKLVAVIAIFLVCLSSAFAEGKKNLILVVADGTGPAVMGLLMQYARLAPNSPYKGEASNLEKLLNDGKMGIVFNTPVKTIATDSAASATQIATGATTYPDALGVDAEGNSVENLLEKAKAEGMGTGLITDVYVLDATPAAFAVHQKSRRSYDIIAKEFVKTQPDVVLGGGLDYFIPEGFAAKNSKYENIVKKIPYASALEPKLKTDEVFQDILKSGYALVFDKKSLLTAKGPKLFGLFSPEAMPFSIEAGDKYPTLKEMTQKAVEVLSKNEKGFFLMVEAGAIDWVAHANDQGAMLKELLEFDDALGYLKNFTDANADTLMIVTADHDTGGFGFNYHKVKGQELEDKTAAGYLLYDKYDYAEKGNLDIIAAQKKTQAKMKEEFEALSEKSKTPKMIQKFIKDNMAYDLSLDYIESKGDDIDDILEEVNKRLGVVWSTTHHTASPLLITFYGADKDINAGVMHSTKINTELTKFLYGNK